MPTPKKGARLGGSPAHQRLILSNLATALFEHGRITTTEAKARVLRPVAEKLITKARKASNGENSLHNRREVLKTIRDKSVVHTLFTEIGPSFAERPGGYTRITKLGPRKGDNAPMAVIELVTESYTPSAPKARATEPATAPAPAPVGEDAPTEMVEETPVETDAPVDQAEVDAVVADEAPAGEVDPVEATAEDADVAVFTQTEESAEIAGETEGGVQGKYAGSSPPLEDADQAPEGFSIKGNEDSMKYHTPDGQWFSSTVAEVWFDTEESAVAAGFTKAGE